MITTSIKYSLRGAITGLKLAEYELDRPDEDVVTMSVCLSAKASMDAFMRQFLLSRSIVADPSLSLAQLVELCAAHDARFKMIRLDKVLCNHLDHRHCESRYCLSTRAVKDCVQAARKLKRLVLDAMNLVESELS